MNKTPVSILQEIMVKKGTIPNYELIHDGGGTHVNTFTYRVTCEGLIAFGTGRCKKDAKHEAANNMLTEIATHRNYPQLPASPAKSPVRTPLPDTIPMSPRIPPNVPFVNAIGELQDLCEKNNLHEPEYTPISDVGPPHARVFTIRCSVSNFIEDGIGTTKKQAKHEAARKMIDKINELVAGLNSIHIEEECLSDNQIALANETAKANYSTLTKLPMVKKINLGIKLNDYHIILKDSLDPDVCCRILEELHKLIIDESNESIANNFVMEKLLELDTILSEIDIKVSLKDLTTSTKNYYMKVIQLDVCPPLIQIGMGKSEAEASYRALINIIDSLNLLLS